MEDSGTARLVNGSAMVRLDPTFASAIDPATKYRVFLTPDGETRELYIAAKSAGSFTIREAQGGQSTVNVDYRILGTALGRSGQRMAAVRSSATALPRVPASSARPRAAQAPR